MTGSRPYPVDILPDESTILLERQQQAIRLRDEWTTVASNTNDYILTLNPKQNSKAVISRLELEVSMIMYYAHTARKLKDVIEVLDEQNATGDPNVWAAESYGETLSLFLHETREEFSRKAADVGERIEKEGFVKARERDVELFLLYACCAGAKVELNWQGPYGDPKEHMEKVIGFVGHSNWKGRMCLNLAREMSRFEVPAHACYGRYLAAAKEGKCVEMRNTLEGLLGAFEMGSEGKGREIAELRRMVVVLKDLNAVHHG